MRYTRSLPASFILLHALSTLAAVAQSSLSVETDKTAYRYGEIMEIRVTVENPTEETLQLTGSSNCQAQFHFDQFSSAANTICTADLIVIQIAPGSWRTWVWKIDPEVHGLPASSGEHTIVGYYPDTGLADTISVSAPEFLGGRVSVGYTHSTPADEIASVRDSLAVVVLNSFDGPSGISESWQISGVSVDSAVARYGQDTRFRYFEADRLIHIDQIVSTERPPERPESAVLTPAYPNPFTTRTTFALKLPHAQSVRVSVYDALGRRVAILHDGPLQAEVRTEISFEPGDLAPGLYLYRVEGLALSLAKTMLLVR